MRCSMLQCVAVCCRVLQCDCLQIQKRWRARLAETSAADTAARKANHILGPALALYVGDGGDVAVLLGERIRRRSAKRGGVSPHRRSTG